MTHAGNNVFDPTIRGEDRECTTHGLTLHRQYSTAGYDGCLTWKCLACQADRDSERDYSKEGRAAAHERWLASQKKHDPPKLCPSCFLALPKTGVCDEC